MPREVRVDTITRGWIWSKKRERSKSKTLLMRLVEMVSHAFKRKKVAASRAEKNLQEPNCRGPMRSKQRSRELKREAIIFWRSLPWHLRSEIRQ